jgi:glutamine---fructose-6-phosphate transaminase (isomerizing)
MRYTDAVRAQGQALRASRAAVTGHLAGLNLAPWRDRPLALVGMGASANAITAVLGSYWSAGLPATGWLGSQLVGPGPGPVGLGPVGLGPVGLGPASAGSASTGSASTGLVGTGPVGTGTAVIAVSQSGKSAEIVAARRAQAVGTDAAGTGQPWLAVTDDPGSPVARLADAVLPLALPGDSNVRTIGHTCTLQSLLLLRDALAGPDQPPAADWDALASELDRLVPAAERLAAALLAPLRGCASFDLVGSGAQAGTAIQGALLLREVAKRPAAAYETYQYLHGPIEAAGPGLALLAVGGPREAKLARSMADAGATVVLITALAPAELAAVGVAVPDGVVGPAAPLTPVGSAGTGGGTGSLTVFRVPAADDVALAVLGIVPVQTISGALADADGRPDGVFRFHQDDTKVTG